MKPGIVLARCPCAVRWDSVLPLDAAVALVVDMCWIGCGWFNSNEFGTWGSERDSCWLLFGGGIHCVGGVYWLILGEMKMLVVGVCGKDVIFY